MKKEKENAFIDFMQSIKQSWTYQKLTDEEKERLNKLLKHNRIIENARGNYYQRFQYLDAIYYSFLIGIGYNGLYWRDEKNKEV